MTKQDLRQKLQELDVNPEFYSLEGNPAPDRMILYATFTDWIVFYFDEHGEVNNERVFDSESDACQYLYNYFKIK